MTTLNNRLQLALLNRKKGRNILEKGFTLVELMIVIVIVGILSAVALPNFLSQTERAKATEAKSLSKAFLTNYHIAKLESAAKATTALTDVDQDPPGACPLDTPNWSFECTADTIVATEVGGDGQTITSTVDSDTGAITIGDLS